jgi:hypothetical protein
MKYHVVTCECCSVMVNTLIQHCLNRVLDSSGKLGHAFVDRLLLALVFHCFKDEDHCRAMKDLDSALSCQSFLECIIFAHKIVTDIHEADFELPPIPAAACLTVSPYLMILSHDL